jgi:thiol-disulfide isomerase/thioredoxin
MRIKPFAVAAILIVTVVPAVFAQKPAPDATPPKTPSDAISKTDADPELELQKALADAGNDRAAVVRNLKAYLQRFPDTPRKAAVYRAIVESCEQLQDNACSLDYAERFVALHPDDSEMMMLAVNLLQEQGDDASLERASGYVSRVLDRIEKSSAAQKPARVSLTDWQQHHDQLIAALYSLRGQIEKSQKNYDAATSDLQKSYAAKPNALAAEQLGELAELRREPAKAIDEYLIAFVLPDDGTSVKVDRREVRKKLGNLWRQVHGGSEQGLGEAVLATYDRIGAPEQKPDPERHNPNAKDAYDFVLRRIDGSAVPLAPEKGKTLVLSFWATWCGPCRELEPEFAQVAKNYAGNPQIDFYAVNTDEDEAAVAPFVAHEKWNVPIVYADGLDVFMKVESLPTVVILNGAGKVAYRTDGFMPGAFEESLTTAIQAAMAAPKL